MRPYAIRLFTENRAGQTDRHPFIRAEEIDAEERIVCGNLGRAGNRVIRRCARFGRLFLKGPGLAGVVGRYDRTLESACGTLLLIAERNSEEGREGSQVAQARILVYGRRPFPLTEQRGLLLVPTRAAVVGVPDSAHLTDYPSMIRVGEIHSVENRLHVGERVVLEVRRKNPLQPPLEKTFAAVGSAQHQRLIADEKAMQPIGKR